MVKVISANTRKEFVSHICKTIEERAFEEIRTKSFFTLVLSGGRTPKVIFEELILNYKETIDWNNVHLFWVDERCVNQSHKDSNYKLAYDNLISKLGSSIGSINRIKGELDPKLAASQYEQDIKLFFQKDKIKFDMILLGMGNDGHVASIFPKSQELILKHKLILATEKKYNNYYRVTMGLDLINDSKFKLLMVKGDNKFKILESENVLYPINRINNMLIVKY